jgi:hypothetical protein
VLDTETTGFSKNDQVIDIAIVDLFGNVLFSSKIKPTVAINPMARRVHRIRDNELKDAPSWADISQEVMSLLKDRKIIIFNAAFDSRMIKQTADAFNEHFIESGQKSKQIRNDIPAEILAEQLSAMGDGMMIMQSIYPERLSIEKIAQFKKGILSLISPQLAV